MSKKLDDILKEAKIDSALMSSLGESIENFAGAAKGIAPTADAMNSTKDIVRNFRWLLHKWNL